MNSDIIYVNPDYGFDDEEVKTSDAIINSVRVSGYFEAWHIRNNEILAKIPFANGLANVGLNDMLGVTFHGDTQKTSWYILPISATSFSALSAADTMASHGGWTETVAYSEGTRPQWTAGSPASKSITNSTPVTFSINADATVVKGIAITSDSAKSGTAGILWSTGLFSGDQTFLNGDQLKVTYTVNLS